MQSAGDPIKVYDARWEVDDFTRPEIDRFFEAVLLYGRELGVDTVTVARDARTGSSQVMEQAVAAAVRSGFTVFLCAEPISTPQSYFLSLRVSAERPRTMGLTITASHNPARYVGLKVVVPIVQAIGLDCGPRGGFTRIRELYHGKETLPASPAGALEIVNLLDEYIDFSLKLAGIREGELDGFAVVLDALNGSAGPELYRALRMAGAAVTPLHLIPDGTFPCGAPNPTSLGKMTPALAAAEKSGAALVIGTDGDGDRLVFGCPRGILNAGFAAVPILRGLLRDRPRKGPVPVMYDPKVNPPALAEWARLDIRPVLFGNGHSQIKEHMRRIDALAAVEESGHFYHRFGLKDLTVYAENSLLTILLLSRSLNRDPGLMEELRDLQSRVFSTGEINYRLADDASRDRALEAVLRSFREDGAVLISETEEGIDLRGTVLRKGAGAGGPIWYSGYIRAATNEKSVLRSYLSSGSAELGGKIERRIREIMEGCGGSAVE